MSDPVSNARVEDVLASIRRLVSQEARPVDGRAASSGDGQDRGTGSSGPETDAAVHDRFVLTPSLRVSDIPAGGEDIADDADRGSPGDEARQDEMWSEGWPVFVPSGPGRGRESMAEQASKRPDGDPRKPAPDRRASEMERVDDGSNTPRGEEEDGTARAPIRFRHFQNDRTGGERGTPVSGAAQDTAPSEDRMAFLRLDESARLPDEAAHVPDREDAASAREPRSGNAIEPQRADPDSKNLERTGDAGEAPAVFPAATPDKDGDRALDLPPEDVSAGVMRAEDGAGTQADHPAPAQDPATSAPGGALETKIAALEAAIARTEDGWEPDGRAGDPYSGKRSHAMDWDDPARVTRQGAPYRLEPEARRDLPATGTPESAGAGAGLPASAAASMPAHPEEDALRQMVADIVRQELQGALGERITRNVRKLVRREILRTLASRDFD